jgi:hypothetical protein
VNPDNNFVLKIYDVNKADSTFAGTYGIISSDDFTEFPLRGQYDPEGITLGWVVSYRSVFGYKDNDAVGVWAGDMILVYYGYEPLWTFFVHWMTIQDAPSIYNVTTGFDNLIPDLA